MRRQLAEQHIELLEYYAAGLTTKAIASGWCLHETTISRQQDKILAKLGADTITQAVAIAIRRGIIA